MKRSLLFFTALLLTACTFGGARNTDGSGNLVVMQGTGKVWPIEGGGSRKILLPFGMHVTPDATNNPIDPPERFSGYHVGTDFEISQGEADKVINVYAVCDGDINSSGFVEGYGGLITEYCTINNEKVTVLYGHLAIDSLVAAKTAVTKGQKIAILGAAHSHDTDENRKHLHFGIVKGWTNDVNGYVQTPEELNLFMDAKTVLPL